jgi:hypothetical protein
MKAQVIVKIVDSVEIYNVGNVDSCFYLAFYEISELQLFTQDCGSEHEEIEVFWHKNFNRNFKEIPNS